MMIETVSFQRVMKIIDIRQMTCQRDEYTHTGLEFGRGVEGLTLELQKTVKQVNPNPNPNPRPNPRP